VILAAEKYHSYLDIGIIIGYMVIVSAALGSIDSVGLKVILGLPLIFVLPGYLMMVALYPQRHTITIPERIALTFGLSVVLLPGIGLLLNFTPFGIRIEPILAGTVLVSALFCALVIYQRNQLELKDQFLPLSDLLQGKIIPASMSSPESKNDKSLIYNILKIGIVASIIGILFMFYMFATTEQPHEHFTEFTILDDSGRIIGKPWELESNRTYDVQININNHEGETIDYFLYLRAVPFTDQWSLDLNGTDGNGSQQFQAGSEPTSLTADQIAGAQFIKDFDSTIDIANNSFIYNFTLADGRGLTELVGFNFSAAGFYQLRLELYTSLPKAQAIMPEYWVYIIVFVS
jgi:uncharacterized membrane protein